MAAIRLIPAVLALSLTLVSCQSSREKAANDQVKVAQGVELVC